MKNLLPLKPHLVFAKALSIYLFGLFFLSASYSQKKPTSPPILSFDRPVLDFSQETDWTLEKKSTAIIDQGKGKFMIRWPASKEKKIHIVNWNHFWNTRFNNSESITVEMEVLQGDTLSAELSLMPEEGGASIDLGNQKLIQGKNKLTWKIPPQWKKRRDNRTLLDRRLFRIIFSRTDDHAASIHLKTLSSHENSTLRDFIEVSLNTHDTIPVIQPSNLKNLKFVIQNPTPNRIAGELSLSIATRVDRTKPFVSLGHISIPPNETISLSIPQNILPQQGHIYLYYQLKLNEEIKSDRLGLAIFEPVAKAPNGNKDFLFNVELKGHELEIEKLFHAFQLTGASTTRVGIAFHKICTSPDPKKWDWSKIDQEIEACVKRKIRPHVVLLGTPKWAKKPFKLLDRLRYEWALPPREKAWRQMVRTAVQRYKEYVVDWEIWNEPNIKFFHGTVEDYLILLRSAHKEIKALQPNARIISGGHTPAIPEHYMRPYNKHMFNETMLKEGQDYFDMHGIHHHGTFSHLQKMVDGYIADYRSHFQKEKPFYWTEVGLDSDYTGEWKQAEELFKKLTFTKARGSLGYSLYHLHAKWRSYPNDKAMFSTDWQPRPHYVTFATLVRHLSHLDYKKELPLEKGYWGFAFENTEKFVISWWKENKGLPDQLYAIPVGDKAKAMEVDMMGNEKQLPIVEGKAITTITQNPKFIIIQNKAIHLQPSPQPIIKIDKPAVYTPGKQLTLSSHITNPFDHQIKFDLKWSIPNTWQNHDTSKNNLLLPPHSQKTHTKSLVTTSTKNFFNSITASYQIKGTPIQGNLTTPLEKAIVVSNTKNIKREPDFHISDYNFIVNKNFGDPSTVHLHWGGPKDLSAKVWVGRDDKHIIVTVDVRDDIFYQSIDGSAKREHLHAHKGDSLQIMFTWVGASSAWHYILFKDKNNITTRRTRGFGRFRDSIKDEKLSWRKIQGKIKKKPNGVRYEIKIPIEIYRFTWEELANTGLRLNVVVNDTDGKNGKDGSLSLVSNTSQGNDISNYPIVKIPLSQ